MEYPIEVLPDEMREAIIAASHLTGVPIPAVAGAVLSMASFAVQGHYDVQTLWNTASRVPVSLFTIAIVGSGGGKTTVFNQVTDGWNKYLSDAINAYEVIKTGYEIDLEVWEQERSKIKSDKSLNGTEKRTALKRHDEVKPIRPPQPNSHFKTFTTAGLIDQLQWSRPSVGFFTSEAGELFKGYSAGSNNGGEIELASQLTNLWDGNSLDKTTLSTGRTLIRDRRASACLMVQADVVKDFFNNRELGGQGIQARLLTARIDRIDKQPNDLSTEGLARKDAYRKRLEAFNAKIYDLVAAPLPTNPDDPYRLEPDLLEWENLSNTNPVNRWHNEIAMHRQNGAGAVESFYNRQFENAHRIAGVIAAFKGEKMISDASGEAAVMLMEYYVDQRENLDLGQAASRYNDLIEPTRYLEEFFRKQKLKGKTVFTMREVQQRASASMFRDLNAEVQQRVLNGMAVSDTLSVDKAKGGNGREVITYTYIL